MTMVSYTWHHTRSKGTERKQMDRLNIIKINNLCVKEYLQESDAYVYGVFCGGGGGAKKVLRLVCCGGFTAP